MGFFDVVSSWFVSNKDSLSRDQQREIERLLDRMRLEMQDNINSATTNTSRRLEVLINNHSKRLNSNIEDTKQYVTNEVTRISNEMKEMKKQQDEEKKKEKGKEVADQNLSDQTKTMLEMMKIILEQQKSVNSCAGFPHGYPPHPGWSQWQQPPAFAPGHQNASYQQAPPPSSNSSAFSSATLSSPVPPNSFGIHPNLQPPTSSTDSNAKDFPKKLVLPDMRDYKKYGLEHEGKAHSSKQSTLKSSTNRDSQLDCGLILPDSRDYNKLVSASIQKKLADEEFEKMIDNFSQEFRPESNTKNKSNEKEIADGVKNFFLKNLDKMNNPRLMRMSRTSSSNASVKEWLKNNENCASDDDSHESDTSEVSVKTDVSKVSSVSAISGKRVFYNKSGNYGKPSSVGSSSLKNKSKSFEPKINKANKYYANQTRNREMRKEQKDTNSAKKDVDSNSTQKTKHSKHSNSNQKDNASEISGASGGTLSVVHYPTREEADRKGLNLFKPLDRELLFLGKNEEDEWTTHQPKCLNEIYDLEKKYKVFRTIEIA